MTINHNTDPFIQKTNNFFSWLISHASVEVSPKITVQDRRHFAQGFCLTAVEDIQQNEQLFKIPRSSILNVETGSLYKEYLANNVSIKASTKDDFLNNTGIFGQWETLILTIFYEIKVKGDSSFWYNYFQILPQLDNDTSGDIFINNLMYWSDEELYNLKPSLVLTRLGKKQSLELYSNIVNILQNDLQILNVDFNWNEFLYIASLVMSYSFDVELPVPTQSQNSNEQGKEEDEEDEEDEENIGYHKSMVILADLLNADTHRCNANLLYSDTHLIMCSIKPIAKNEQIYNTYGDYPNSELLRRYGYVEWQGSKYDFGEVPLINIKKFFQSKYFSNKNDSTFIDIILQLLSDNEYIVSNILEDETIVMESYDCYINGEIMDEFLCLVQLLTVVCENYQDFVQISSNTIGELGSVLKRIIKLYNNKNMLSGTCIINVKLIFDDRLKEYPNHAFRELNDSISSDNMLQVLREHMADCVLQSEVNSIKNCFNNLEIGKQILTDVDYIGELNSKRKNKRLNNSDVRGNNNNNKRYKKC
ncbi:related to Ribosomal N-lysine methyltransferase 4 [Saccharomycodes ludwigii]|uniref:Related to Ribosomal N-lysine methyltransferase 4 n=1 Tax=Saccharomycodes ludwigii TaxID=36035 RepID=A0A376B317_9ASCO|nr:hypothetical protein SCDLUD_004875 [Saccharomycodes ludwigii]KAH3899432.1 hypothetical protein SCDLUD_004875 [Saccharomycodes ludwigii]SSD59002.1 related to Ribosomal N-lysine methyltransferase 4 [Saccharomycodes ludwigii]